MPPTASGSALHGTVLDRPWRVDGTPTAGTADLSVPLGPPWPWAGSVRATWQLREHELEATLTIASAGETFPAAAGWHPWFRRRLDHGGPVRVEVPGDTMLERGADYLPTGRVLEPRPEGPYDDTFPLPGGRAALRLARRAAPVLPDRLPVRRGVRPPRGRGLPGAAVERPGRAQHRPGPGDRRTAAGRPVGWSWHPERVTRLRPDSLDSPRSGGSACSSRSGVLAT